jgi:hypothetical protein
MTSSCPLLQSLTFNILYFQCGKKPKSKSKEKTARNPDEAKKESGHVVVLFPRFL